MNQSDDNPVDLVSAGVDWLTMTLRPEHDKTQYRHMRAVHLLSEINKQGYELKSRSMLGYSGLSAGNCFVGTREDGLMMQFTGFHADGVFDQLYDEMANISRIDLQVTVRYTVMPTGVARKAYSDADTANRRLPLHRRRKLYIIMGSDGGDTFYCGSATSDQRGRLYNKEIQSEEPMYARTWRYEVVYRNDRAKVVAASIRNRSGDRAAAVRNIVFHWWTGRGVDCAHFATGEGDVIPLFRTLPTDIERKLHWLRHQVRPTIKLLVELGMYDELVSALDLSVPEAAQRQKGDPA